MKKRRKIFAAAAVLCLLCGAAFLVWRRSENTQQRISLPDPEAAAAGNVWDPLLAQAAAGEDLAEIFAALSPDQRLLAVAQGAAWAEKSEDPEAMMVFINAPVMEALGELTEKQVRQGVGEKGYTDNFRWLLLDYYRSRWERNSRGYNAVLARVAGDREESELLRFYAAREYEGSNKERRALLTAVMEELTGKDYRKMLERDLSRLDE